MSSENEMPENVGNYLQEGDLVHFEIVMAEFKRSKSSNAEMFEVGMNVTNKNGATGSVREYVLVGNAGRLGSFLRAIGMSAEGRVSAAEMVGKKGRASLKYEEAQGKYPAKWRIARWGTLVQFRESVPVRPRHAPQADAPPWVAKWGLVTQHALRYGLEVPTKDGAEIVAELESLTGWAAVPGIDPTIAQGTPKRPGGTNGQASNQNAPQANLGAKNGQRPDDDNVPF